MILHADRIVQETKDYFSKWGDSGLIDLKEALSGKLFIGCCNCPHRNAVLLLLLLL